LLRDIRYGYMSHLGQNGIHISCAVWQNAQPTSGSLSLTWFGADRRMSMKKRKKRKQSRRPYILIGLGGVFVLVGARSDLVCYARCPGAGYLSTNYQYSRWLSGSPLAKRLELMKQERLFSWMFAPRVNSRAAGYPVLFPSP
jgi:hypothetical protein